MGWKIRSASDQDVSLPGRPLMHLDAGVVYDVPPQVGVQLVHRDKTNGIERVYPAQDDFVQDAPKPEAP